MWPRHRISKKNRKRLGHGCIFVWSGGQTRGATMPPKRRRERCPEIPFRVRDLLAPVNAARRLLRARPDTRARSDDRARGHHRRGRGAQPRRAGTDGPRQAGGDDASRLDAPHALAPHDRVPRRPPRQARRPVRARARARAHSSRAATNRAPASVSLAQVHTKIRPLGGGARCTSGGTRPRPRPHARVRRGGRAASRAARRPQLPRLDRGLARRATHRGHGGRVRGHRERRRHRQRGRGRSPGER